MSQSILQGTWGVFLFLFTSFCLLLDISYPRVAPPANEGHFLMWNERLLSHRIHKTVMTCRVSDSKVSFQELSLTQHGHWDPMNVGQREGYKLVWKHPLFFPPSIPVCFLIICTVWLNMEDSDCFRQRVKWKGAFSFLWSQSFTLLYLSSVLFFGNRQKSCVAHHELQGSHQENI